MPRMDLTRFMLCSATVSLALLSISKPAQGEGGSCPSGMYPIGGGNAGWTGCAPIPGYPQPGGNDSAPAPNSPSRITDYRYSSHFALVMHPGAGDVWVTWNYQAREMAEQEALSACTKIMGRGCIIGVSGWNGSIATVRSEAGQLWFSVGKTEKEASSKALKSCSNANQKCKVENVFTAKAWKEPVSWNEERHRKEAEARMKRYFPNSSVARTQTPPVGANIPATAPLLARQAFEAKYGKPLFEDVKGLWMMSGKGDGTGKECAASFLASSGSTFVSLFGPNQKSPGMILFQGPTIPQTDKPKEIRTVLSSNDAPPATVRAILVPMKDKSAAIIVPTDMIVTMRGAKEATWMTLQLDGKEVFRTDMAGSMVARDAMLKCMQASR
jgi:Domain of unknown function (DUF4189)